MKRRRFLKNTLLAGAGLPHMERLLAVGAERRSVKGRELSTDLLVVGGGLGGCAAALAALRNGLRVVLTEETDWIGGQLTQQAVPPDEHRWIEQRGCTRLYRRLRNEIRDYYRRYYPLTPRAQAEPLLNPGNGSVSRLCHEPRVAKAVLDALLAPHRSAGRLLLLLEHRPTGADVEGDRIRCVHLQDLESGNVRSVTAAQFIDATELGDLLPLTGTEFVTGAEAQSETGEPHAAEKADPNNEQACTACFAIDFVPSEEHLIEKPATYDFWRDFVPQLQPPWPGRLLDLTYSHPATLKPRELGFNPAGPTPAGRLNLWVYRRLLDPANFESGAFRSGISLVNWPQNDYFLSPLTVSVEERDRRIQEAKQLSLSLLYWLQTEAPREDGRSGFPELRLRPDVVGTADGLAKFPYVREARRIRAEFTVLEQHVGRAARAEVTGGDPQAVRSARFFDTVGIGSYHIDLHPSTGGDNYIDFPSLPFQIPLGALLPQRVDNLLAAAKNIGVTHVTNGCYRLHPVEWNVGEAAGALAAFAHRAGVIPRAVRADLKRLADFQASLLREGFELEWPDEVF